MTITPGSTVTSHQIGRDFILAGNATFTIIGKVSRFTFKVTQADAIDGRPAPHFVGLLTGSNNETDYSYIGIIRHGSNQVTRTAKSRITADAPAFVAVNWVLPILFAGRQLPAPAAVVHEGRCGRCGRKLTVPESVVSGFGPECASKMGVTAPVLPAGNGPDATFLQSEL